MAAGQGDWLVEELEGGAGYTVYHTSRARPTRVIGTRGARGLQEAEALRDQLVLEDRRRAAYAEAKKVDRQPGGTVISEVVAADNGGLPRLLSCADAESVWWLVESMTRDGKRVQRFNTEETAQAVYAVRCREKREEDGAAAGGDVGARAQAVRKGTVIAVSARGTLQLLQTRDAVGPLWLTQKLDPVDGRPLRRTAPSDSYTDALKEYLRMRADEEAAAQWGPPPVSREPLAPPVPTSIPLHRRLADQVGRQVSRFLVAAGAGQRLDYVAGWDVEGEYWSCSCPGYSTRGRCSHLAALLLAPTQFDLRTGRQDRENEILAARRKRLEESRRSRAADGQDNDALRQWLADNSLPDAPRPAAPDQATPAPRARRLALDEEV